MLKTVREWTIGEDSNNLKEENANANEEKHFIGIYNGFLAGLIASGGYDLFKMIVAAVTGKLKTWDDVEDLLDDGKIKRI